MKRLKTIYIRKELYSNEYRSPLCPTDVKRLIINGYFIYVQSSKKRCFRDEEYINAGAIITDKEWYYYKNAYIIGIQRCNNFDKLNQHIHYYFVYDKKEKYIFKKMKSYLIDYNSINNDLNFNYFDKISVMSACIFYIIGNINLIRSYNSMYDIINYIKSKINNNENLKNNLKNQIFNICILNNNIINNNNSIEYFLHHFEDLMNFSITHINNNNINNINNIDNIDNNIDNNKELSQYNIIINKTGDLQKLLEKYYNKKTIILNLNFNDIDNLPIETYLDNPIYKLDKNLSVISIKNISNIIAKESSLFFSNKLTNHFLVL